MCVYVLYIYFDFICKNNIHNPVNCAKLTEGPKVKLAAMKKVYEPPNPNSMLYLHDCKPFCMVKVALSIRKPNVYHYY